MIRTNDLGKSYGDRTLFAGVTVHFNPGSRYGLVGANGCGKTTFLKILAGDEPASDGSVVVPQRARVGVLRQDQFLDDDQIILDLAMMGDRVAWEALHKRASIIDGLSGDPSELAELEETLAHHDGYTLEARTRVVLEGLGIATRSHPLPLSSLSGGFKLRVLLARVLVSGPDMLMLDEPTNHLDILSIRWLEKFLAGYRGAALVISHDQRFLDNVATHILDVDYGTVTAYVGNYSSFVTQKEGERARKEAEIARAQKIIAEKRAFVDRFGAKATKAKQAQSRLKQIERIEVATLAPSSRRTPLFRFVQDRPSGREVLELEGIGKSYGEKRVLSDVSLHVRRGEKLAVIGPNGLGKSTLLKIAMGLLAPDCGRAQFGHEAQVGYFAQDHHDLLQNEDMTALQYLWDACPLEPTSAVRGQLGRVLFSGEDVEKKVGSLSGGEAARLIFGRIIAEKPNVLVLDEPTNHLDFEAIGALADGLSEFEGTVLFVSHDRWFVSRLATRILELRPEGPRDFPGTYQEYLERCGDDHLDAEVVLQQAKSEVLDGAKGDKASKQAANWEEQKKRNNRRQALPARRDKVLAAIETAESRKAAIAEAYAREGFFQKVTPSELHAIQAEETALTAAIDAWMAEWEAIEGELLSDPAG